MLLEERNRVNIQLLEDIKRKRDEHSALTTAEQHNIQVARKNHMDKVALDEKRLKAAWEEIQAARIQVDVTKNEQDNKSKELAVWQRQLEMKDLGLQDIETSLNNQNSVAQEKIRKYRGETEDKLRKLQEMSKTVNDLLEKMEYSIHML